MKNLKYWVAINVSGIGLKIFQKLWDYFGDVEKIWQASGSEFRKIGLQNKTITAFLEKRHKISPEKEIQKVQKLGINLLTLQDKKYPGILREIINPPYLIYYKGEFKKNDEIALGVVGTRRLTPYGKRVCENIVTGLALNKLTIISGLALGIDTIAHKTALENKTRTIAVLGTGIDNIYPYTNIKLAKEIEKNGVILSEFPLGTQGLRYNFPQRNRIISGLSLGTLVIEAATRSGALITANYALEQNREVFAVPGSIYNPQSAGVNNLIKMGAKVVTNYQDILDELNIEDKIEKETRDRELNFENEIEKKIWQILDSDQSLHIDIISKKLKKDISEISSSLTLMEMRGMIKNLGGQNYVRK